MRYQGERRWLYERDVRRFAKRFLLTKATDPRFAEILASRRKIAKKYDTNVRIVSADIKDACHEEEVLVGAFNAQLNQHKTP